MKTRSDKSSKLIPLVLMTVLIAVCVLNIFFNPDANTGAHAMIIFVLFCVFVAGTDCFRSIRDNGFFLECPVRCRR